MFHQRFSRQPRKIVYLLILYNILLLVIYFYPRQNPQPVSNDIQSNNEKKSHYDETRKKELVRKGLAEMIQIREFVRRLLDDPDPESKQSKDLKPDYFRHLVPFNDLLNIFESLNDETKAKDERELQILQERVNKRIDEIQNPKDCKKAKKFVCIVNHVCGAGCTMQYFCRCMAIALGTNRTLIIDFSRLWHEGLNEIIKPPSDTCLEADMTNALEWKSMTSQKPPPPSTPVLKMTIKGNLQRTLFAPYTIPEILLEKLQRHHSDPNRWWIGQMMTYLTRPQPWLLEKMEAVRKNKFTHPIAGIHVRRTEKITETLAKYHELKEYMAHVDEWYDRYEMKYNVKVTRKVYLATEDTKVIEEAKASFPDYDILYATDQDLTLRQRYQKENQRTIFCEVKLLSQCDYFVGTYSSNIGVLVSALMQARKDATFKMVSLDRTVRYLGSHPIFHEALLDHTASGIEEISMIVGDRIQRKRYMPVSYKGYGTNLRTSKMGYYPLYKVKEVLTPAPYYGF